MNFRNVLLIRPYYRENFYQSTAVPVGLGYLASVLKLNDIDYEVMDMGLDLGRKYNFSDLEKKIRKFNPDLIAISLMSYRYKDHYKLLRMIRQVSAKFKIVAGGPHISCCREKVLEECQEIDYGVILEGEDTLVELCRGVALQDIKGLIYRNNGVVRFNNERPFIDDLDSIPFPRYEKFDLNMYSQDLMPIFTSRGCPYSCIYCAAGKVMGKTIRTRSIASLIDEIEYWYKNGYTDIEIGDDNFTFHKERAVLFCEEIIKRGLNKVIRLSAGNGIRADRVDKELLELMKRANFFCVGIGVEAGNNKILSNLKKGERIEVIENTIRNCSELGIEVKLYFLVGSPGETERDLDDSIKLALKYPVRTARFYNIIPYPYTELFEWIEKNNYFIFKPEVYLNEIFLLDPEPVFQTPEMSYKKRKLLLRKTDKVRRKTERIYWQRKWKRLGLLSILFSRFYTLNIVQRSWVRKRWFSFSKEIARRLFHL